MGSLFDSVSIPAKTHNSVLVAALITISAYKESLVSTCPSTPLIVSVLHTGEEALCSFGSWVIGSLWLKVELQLPLVVLLLLDQVVAFSRAKVVIHVHRALAALLGLPFLSILIYSHLASLLDCILHHFLLFEPLADVVAIQTQIALFTETQQYLRAEAAADDRSHGQYYYQVRPFLKPF